MRFVVEPGTLSGVPGFLLEMAEGTNQNIILLHYQLPAIAGD